MGLVHLSDNEEYKKVDFYIYVLLQSLSIYGKISEIHKYVM